MNKIHIAGFLGADPIVQYTPTGKKVIKLRIGSKTRKKGADDTIWWRGTIWGEQYDKMLPYLKKGSAVMIIAEFNKPEIYTDKEGKPQISLDVTIINIEFSPFGKPQSSSDNAHSQETPEAPVAPQAETQETGITSGTKETHEITLDDEIPF